MLALLFYAEDTPAGHVQGEGGLLPLLPLFSFLFLFIFYGSDFSHLLAWGIYTAKRFAESDHTYTDSTHRGLIRLFLFFIFILLSDTAPNL
jgi:hypothetical protein